MTDYETPPIEDSAQKKTASGQTGGGISNGAEDSNLNNQSITDPDDKSKGNDGWELVRSTVEKPVMDQLSTLRIAVYQGYLWRKTEDGWGYERKLRPESSKDTQPEATERHETHEAEQSQSQQETGSEKADKDWRGGDYYSYTSEGCAHRAFDRAIKYKSDDRTYWQTKGIFLTIASAARRNEAGEWVTKMTISSLTGDTHGNASRKIKGWIERLEKAGLLIPLETSKRDGRAWKMGFPVHRG